MWLFVATTDDGFFFSKTVDIRRFGDALSTAARIVQERGSPVRFFDLDDRQLTFTAEKSK